MARKADNPQAWEAMVEALDSGKIEKASKIAKESDFFKVDNRGKGRRRNRKRVYRERHKYEQYAQKHRPILQEWSSINRTEANTYPTDEKDGCYAVSPTGEVIYGENTRELGEKLGISHRLVRNYTNKAYVLVGGSRYLLPHGWQFYRVKKGETNKRRGKIVPSDIVRMTVEHNGSTYQGFNMFTVARSMRMSTAELEQMVADGTIKPKYDNWLKFEKEQLF